MLAIPSEIDIFKKVYRALRRKRRNPKSADFKTEQNQIHYNRKLKTVAKSYQLIYNNTIDI